MKKLLVLLIVTSSVFGVTKTNAQVSVGISVSIAPPVIPVYVQPPCPVAGYIWTPGYWAWGDDGYYWVPGVWVAPPVIGFLWTPGYWGWGDGHYWWHAGYWGPHVGFYGGVNYGFGYYGTGFCGGRWDGRVFRYNTAVVRVNSAVVRNTYVDRTVIVHNDSRVSYNGPGGITRQPNSEERTYMSEHHTQATSAQQNHVHTASMSRYQRASYNQGRPSTMARSSVGGQRYNAAGNAMHSASHTNTMHPAQRTNAARPQMQHTPMQNRGAMQNRGGGMQRQAQPARAMHGGGHGRH